GLAGSAQEGSVAAGAAAAAASRIADDDIVARLSVGPDEVAARQTEGPREAVGPAVAAVASRPPGVGAPLPALTTRAAAAAAGTARAIQTVRTAQRAPGPTAGASRAAVRPGRQGDAKG